MTIARSFLWLLLALPAVVMIAGGDVATALLQPTGEASLLLIIAALLPGPLADAFGRNRLLRTWLGVRRNLGVAGCLYGVLHLLFYVIDMGQLAAMLDEASLPAIWTGWIALALLVAAASISFDRAMRMLGRRWKHIQRVVYGALLLALVHWTLLDRAAGPALVHLAPLLIAWSLRGWARKTRGIVMEGSKA